jgi:hypothetical protein
MIKLLDKINDFFHSFFSSEKSNDKNSIEENILNHDNNDNQIIEESSVIDVITENNFDIINDNIRTFEDLNLNFHEDEILFDEIVNSADSNVSEILPSETQYVESQFLKSGVISDDQGNIIAAVFDEANSQFMIFSKENANCFDYSGNNLNIIPCNTMSILHS